MLFSEVVSVKGEVQVSSNGRYFAAPISTTKVSVKKILSNGQLSTDNIIQCSFQVTNINLSPDSQYVLVWSTKQNLASVFDIKGNTICKIQQGTGIFNCFWVPDSKQVLILSPFKLTAYNLTNGTTSWFKSIKQAQKGCVFSNCGKYLALAERRECKDYVGVYFTTDWKLLNHFSLNEMLDLAGLVWAPNNSFLVAWDSHLNYKLIPICLLNGVQPKYSAYQYALGIKDCVYSHNSLLLAAGSYDQKIRILNAMTWKLVGELDCPSSVSAGNIICYKQKQKERQIAAKNTPSLHQLDPLSGTVKIPSIKVVASDKQQLRQGIRLMQISPSDNYIAAKNDNMPNVLWIWSLKNLSLVSVIVMSNNIRSFEWSPQKDILCVVNGSPHIFFWSIETLLMVELPYMNNPIQPTKLKWTGEGKSIVFSDKINATLMEVYEGLANKLISSN